MKDLANLENDLRIGANEDFNEETKKLIEMQKSRVHDIVHGGFLAINSLIPNPIKASIRAKIRARIAGKESDESVGDTEKSKLATDHEPTNIEIRTTEKEIRDLAAKDELEKDLKKLV